MAIKSQTFITLSLLTILTTLCAPPPQKSSDLHGRVTSITGTCEQFDRRTRKWKPCVIGTPILSRDSIRTGGESKLEILFDSLNSVTVGESATVSISSIIPDSSSDTILQVSNFGGDVLSDMKKLLPHHSYRVVTPTATAAIRGTYFSVTYIAESNISDVEVFEGIVWVSNPRVSATTVAVEPGFVTVVGIALAPAMPIRFSEMKFHRLQWIMKKDVHSRYRQKFNLRGISLEKTDFKPANQKIKFKPSSPGISKKSKIAPHGSGKKQAATNNSHTVKQRPGRGGHTAPVKVSPAKAKGGASKNASDSHTNKKKK